jgi:hypothetical protein
MDIAQHMLLPPEVNVNLIQVDQRVVLPIHFDNIADHYG